MRKRTVSVFMIAGLLSVLLSGCRTGVEPEEGVPENVPGTESEAEQQISALPYQFAGRYGIIKSENPVYELDSVIESKIPQKEKEVSLTFAICQKQELIINIVMDDYSDVRKTAADGERYQNRLWQSGEGLFLTGPGMPEAGIKPKESLYAVDPAYLEAYGRMHYVIAARFELPSAYEENMSGYSLRLLDFEKPLEFALKRVPEYGTLEELAAEEQGGIAVHDGISIISMGERVKEGILVSWYVYSDAGERQVSITYTPPLQEVDLPTISSDEKQYPIKQAPARPFWDTTGLYRLSDTECYGPRYSCLFDVPQKEQNAAFQVNIPGITFLSSEEASPVTLAIPEAYEELNEDIPWKEGSVRILGITRMEEPQSTVIEDAQGSTKVRESPAVYIDVTAVHEDKNLALRGLICERKLQWTGWERERYDFDGRGNLSGFRVFYEEGDREVTLKFSRAAFYWNQPYVMELPLPD